MPVIMYRSALQKLRQTELPHFFLLQGKEEYLAREFIKKLQGVLKERKESLEYREFREIDSFDELTQAIITFPFKNSNRLIICYNIKISQLIPFLQRAVPALYLAVFLEEGLRPSDSGYCFFKNEGWVVSCSPLQSKEFLAWMQDKAREQGKEMSLSAAEYLRFLCNSDMAQVSSEITKAALYLGPEDKPISLEVLQKVSKRTVERSVFDLVDAVVAKKHVQVGEVLKNLQVQGYAPIFLTSLLVKHFLQLFEAAVLIEEGEKVKNLARELKLHPYVGKKLGKQVSFFKIARIEGILSTLRELDRSLKTSKGDPQIILEAAIADILES